MQSKIVRSVNITAIEAFFYVFLAIVVAIGLMIAAYDEGLYRNTYVVEDGVLEYFTALMLFTVAVICFTRILRDRHAHTKAFVLTNAFIVLLMVFGAGEEVSWGQRIFNVESSEFFLENNRQFETNLHNMSVNGVNINKLIFGKMLALFLVMFYLILPWVYLKKAAVQRLFDRFYIPVPKPHHGIAMLIAALAIHFVASSKKGELNEVCLSVFFFLAIFRPQNKFTTNAD
jgi:hypothetical protein